MGDTEVGDGLGVVEDAELEIFIVCQHIGDLDEEISQVQASGGGLFLEKLFSTSDHRSANRREGGLPGVLPHTAVSSSPPRPER